MTISETTYRAIEMMLPDEATIEKLGAAYEAGDLTELGRLYAAAINTQISKDGIRYGLGPKAGLFGQAFDAQFNALFSRDAGGKL